MTPWLDCSMLAVTLGLVLVVVLGLAGFTSTLIAALHVGSKSLLACFDALSWVPHARAHEESADNAFVVTNINNCTSTSQWDMLMTV